MTRESEKNEFLEPTLTLSYEADNIARLSGCNLINLECTFNSFQDRVNGWGGGYLSVYKNGVTNLMERHLWLHLGERKWEFEQHGQPYGFENVELFKSQFSKDKLNPQHLDNICKHFNIDFTNESFYNTNQAFIITINRDKYDNELELNLKDVRNKCGCNMYDKEGNKTKEFYIPDFRLLKYYIRFHSNLQETISKVSYFNIEDWRLPNKKEIIELNEYLVFLETQKIENKKTLKQIKKIKNAIEIIIQ